MMSKLWIACISVAALVAGPALLSADDAQTSNDQESKLADAQESKSGADTDALFARLDKDGDGMLTADEVDESRRRLFQRLLRRADKNSDGKLAREEFAQGMKDDRPEPPTDPLEPPGMGAEFPQFLRANPEQLFKQLDANGDSKLALSEVPEPRRARLTPFLTRADADGDKFVTLDEFRKAHQILRAQFGAAPRTAPGPLAGAGPVGAALLRTLDADGDGTLSAEEIAVAGEALKKLDTDGDGSVSRRELLAVVQGANRQPAAPDAGPNPQRLLARLRQLDKDGDGKLKKEELPPFLQNQFDEIDANGDGLADFDELTKAAEAMRKRFEQSAAKQKGQK